MRIRCFAIYGNEEVNQSVGGDNPGIWILDSDTNYDDRGRSIANCKEFEE